MGDSPSACVVDANVVIDLHAGGLLPAALRRPFQLVAPDFVVDELVDPDGRRLVRQGLREESLSPSEVSELYDLRLKHPRDLALADLSTIVLARRLRSVLLTREHLLSMVAQQEGMTVQDTMWLLDEMVSRRTLTPRQGGEAVSRMLAAGRRLPKEWREKRLRAWKPR